MERERERERARERVCVCEREIHREREARNLAFESALGHGALRALPLLISGL